MKKAIALLTLLFIILGNYAYCQTALVGDGQVTIVYHHYIPATRMFPEPAESGGGIKAYWWIIYPESCIDSKREATQEGVNYLQFHEYVLNGSSDDESNVISALKNNRPVICGLRRPDVITLKIPAGHYYLDYWIQLYGKSNWGDADKIGPRSFGNGNNDWGPLEFQVQPNSVIKINIIPYGDNFDTIYVGYDITLTGILNLINYGDRLGP